MALGRTSFSFPPVPSNNNARAIRDAYLALLEVQRVASLAAGPAVLVANVAITKHNLVSINAGRLVLADRSPLVPAVGIALETVSAGAKCRYQLIQGYIDRMSGLTTGAWYYLDNTPGAMTVTAPVTPGDYQQGLGFALSTTEFLLNISAPVPVLI